jgi:hypothetical protein
MRRTSGATRSYGWRRGKKREELCCEFEDGRARERDEDVGVEE